MSIEPRSTLANDQEETVSSSPWWLVVVLLVAGAVCIALTVRDIRRDRRAERR